MIEEKRERKIENDSQEMKGGRRNGKTGTVKYTGTKWQQCDEWQDRNNRNSIKRIIKINGTFVR
jgi:hypothetical protein